MTRRVTVLFWIAIGCAIFTTSLLVWAVILIPELRTIVTGNP